jgi:Guanylate-binding protein, N-terminal domain
VHRLLLVRGKREKEMSDTSDDSALVMVDFNDVDVNPSDDTAVPALADENVVVVDSSGVVDATKNILQGVASSSSNKINDDTTPTAHQIVSIGTEEDAYAFHFDQEKLNEILKRIPMGWEVAVVSVVGAFRTGKSFLLSWFLRYLHCLEKQGTIVAVDATNKKKNTAAAAAADAKPWYGQFPSLGNDGFDWKAGSERNTTGIWMWSQPYFIQRNNGDNQKPLAVLLVDTQGMFDHETTMSLTASIFGFSTLLSSFQIYNVDKRIQEDNLQQLALFSEYARSAMGTEEKEEKQKKKREALLKKNLVTKDDETEETLKEESENKDPVSSSSTNNEDITASNRRPFQQIEFLVRDWQVRL